MKPKTQEYVQFIKENHKDFGGQMNGAAVAKGLGISQGRISQLLKEIKVAPTSEVATVEAAVAVEA